MKIADRYTLKSEVGRGGTGVVWRARDEMLGRDVAIKKIGMSPGATEPDLVRAEREAKLAARVNHPHVVAVYDFVDDGDDRWLVMELVDGITLADLVRRDGPLSPDQAAHVIGQAAEALAAAHEVGIVHRDVKPSNLLVTADGTVKLTDFGIARAEADASLTQTGLVTGSPAYLAPEVAAGQVATSESDVWALGATLFHALSGKPPFESSENVLGTMYRIVHEDPPRLDDAGRLAPLLEATMAKDPVERWSMRDVQESLADDVDLVLHDPTLVTPTVSSVDPEPTSVIAAESPGPAFVAKPSSRRWLPAAAAAVIAVIVVVGALAIREAGVGQADPSEAAGTSPSSESASNTPPASIENTDESADAMAGFVQGYLNTVVDHPQVAWTLLTPQFQEESGGFEEYEDFWGPYVSAQIRSIEADPESRTVRYSVSYTDDEGEGFDDTVTLELEPSGESFLIAGETKG